jgi:hypothetical protein
VAFQILVGTRRGVGEPWVTFMGRPVSVPNMPESAQKCLGIFDMTKPGVI